MTGARLALIVIGTGLVVAGCGHSGTTRPAVIPESLPTGPLSTLVPQPGEVPTGLILVTGQSGPAGLAKLAGFVGGGAAAAKAKNKLQSDGFVDAYIVEYATKGGRTLAVVVSQFATVAGADHDLAADLSGTTPVPGLGDVGGEKTQALPGGPAGGQLVTERFRVGDRTYLVAVGGPQGVDVGDVRSVAIQLAARGRTA